MKKALYIFFLIILFPFLAAAKEFKGAEYRTKAAYTYGRFEAKIKSVQREGTLASFFTYYDEGGGVNTWNEIDIEILGRYTDDVQFNTITPGQTNHVRHQNVNFNPALDYHVYAFEWTPSYVAWFIDGNEVYRQTGAHIQTLNRAQKIMMNIWNPAYPGWVGTWNPDVLPAFAYYDFVSYYSYTPGAGNYGSGNNFTHQWTDDFDSLDTSRWDRATHTWDGNNCDFVQQNVAFNNGKMILCLTNSTNLGYTDIKDPVNMWARESRGKITAYFSEELDRTSAENISNYSIPGVNINSALLQNDLKTVMLDVLGYQQGGSYNLVTQNIEDIFNNSSALKAVSVINSVPLTFPLYINVGGGVAYSYLPDTLFSEKTEYGYFDGIASVQPSSVQIGNTDEDSVYRAERYGLAAYKIRVPNGIYRVKLMFAENYFTASNKRIFDVNIENMPRANNLDLYTVAGLHNAYNLTYDNITINDGVIDIHFSSEVENPLINGIAVEQIYVNSVNEGNIVPDKYKIEQNYPNPFNGTTIFKYTLPESERISLSIYNIIGKKVFSTEIDSAVGENKYIWNGKDNYGNRLSSGVYFYNFKGGDFSQTKKMILLN